MIKQIKNLDIFGKNIILVFLGTSLVNLFNLLFQLMVAHRLKSADFASFNSLIAVFTLISAPLANFQTVLSKYTAEFNAHKQIAKLKFLLSDLLKKTLIVAIVTFLIFQPIAILITNKLKVPSVSCGYILAFLFALSWVNPVFSGAIQGLEFFGWLVGVSILTGALKLALGFLLIISGFNITGALSSLLVSGLIGLIIFYFPLRQFIAIKIVKEDINYRQMFIYLFPVAISTFCYVSLVNLDMVLVKYFFMPDDSGLYSIAQMVGKIFLFLPAAISVVMFPRTSRLNAKNMDTASTLKRSLLYAAVLCISAGLIYNLFPALVLRILTGKVFKESIVLGRLFSISMAFFTLLYLLITYFLSIKDLRFIKYLILFSILQFWAIILFHKSLMQVQVVLCINSVLLFCIHFALIFQNNRTKNILLNRINA